jgi:hypothetical protein
VSESFAERRNVMRHEAATAARRMIAYFDEVTRILGEPASPEADLLYADRCEAAAAVLGGGFAAGKEPDYCYATWEMLEVAAGLFRDRSARFRWAGWNDVAGEYDRDVYGLELPADLDPARFTSQERRNGEWHDIERVPR